MRFRAVIFDLFGTLTQNPALQTNTDLIKQMASILTAPPEEFLRLWRDTFNQRCSGDFPTIESNIEYICRGMNIPADNEKIALATRLRAKMVKHEMSFRADAVAVLSNLKTNGHKTGLISDCSPPVPDIWPETALSSLIDVTVFSCNAGLKKPDPSIYRLAMEKLAVESRECLYVGDGSSQELTGAAAVGMHPVLIQEPDEDSAGVYRVDAETESWDGPAISSLTEILTLVS